MQYKYGFSFKNSHISLAKGLYYPISSIFEQVKEYMLNFYNNPDDKDRENILNAFLDNRGFSYHFMEDPTEDDQKLMFELNLPNSPLQFRAALLRHKNTNDDADVTPYARVLVPQGYVPVSVYTTSFNRIPEGATIDTHSIDRVINAAYFAIENNDAHEKEKLDNVLRDYFWRLHNYIVLLANSINKSIATKPKTPHLIKDLRQSHYFKSYGTHKSGKITIYTFIYDDKIDDRIECNITYTKDEKYHTMKHVSTNITLSFLSYAAQDALDELSEIIKDPMNCN